MELKKSLSKKLWYGFHNQALWAPKENYQQMVRKVVKAKRCTIINPYTSLFLLRTLFLMINLFVSLFPPYYPIIPKTRERVSGFQKLGRTVHDLRTFFLENYGVRVPIL